MEDDCVRDDLVERTAVALSRGQSRPIGGINSVWHRRWIVTLVSAWLGCVLLWWPAAVAGATKEKLRFYEVLGIDKGATVETIKQQFRSLSKTLHPDRSNDKDAHSKFADLREAYEVLSNASERAQYDRLGDKGYKEFKARDNQQGGDGFWADSPFSFFGGGRRAGEDQAPPLQMKLYVTLQQLYFGDLFHVAFKRPVLCMHVEECLTARTDCGGAGTRVVRQQVGPGFIVQNQMPDDTCVSQGKGWKKNCSKCPNGSSEIDKTFVSVYVEPGMRSGEKLEFRGVGWQMLAHAAGDLVFQLVELPNSLKMERHGNNLHTEMWITLLEALVGFSKRIRHISGDSVTIEKTGVTADGEVEILKENGMPVAGESGKFGDLFVTLKLQYPVSLNAQQQAKAREALGDVTNWKFTTTK